MGPIHEGEFPSMEILPHELGPVAVCHCLILRLAWWGRGGPSACNGVVHLPFWIFHVGDASLAEHDYTMQYALQYTVSAALGVPSHCHTGKWDLLCAVFLP